MAEPETLLLISLMVLLNAAIILVVGLTLKYVKRRKFRNRTTKKD